MVDIKFNPSALQNLMSSHHVTITSLAAETGVDEKSVKNWLAGTHVPKGEPLTLICLLFQIRAEDLFSFDKGDPKIGSFVLPKENPKSSDAHVARASLSEQQIRLQAYCTFQYDFEMSY